MAIAGVVTGSLVASMGLGAISMEAGAATSGGKKPLYILADVDLSGTFGHYGQVDLQGLKAQVKIINQKGGVNGRKLVIKSLDNQSDPATAVIVAKDLLSSVPKTTVLFMFPGAVGVTALAILPVVSKTKVLNITPSATSQTENFSAFPYTFIAYPDEEQQAPPQVAGLKQLAGNSKKAALIVGTDSGDQANIAPLEAEMKKAGLTLTVETVSLTAKDYTAQLQQAKQSGAKALYVKIDNPASYVTVMQGVQQLGWTTVKVLAGPTAANAAVLNVIPTAVQKQFYALGQRVYLQGFGKNTKTFQARYKALASFGTVTDIGISSDIADDVNMAVWAYKTAGGNTQAKKKAALNNLGKKTFPKGTLLVLPQPHYTKVYQTLHNADFSTFWGLLRAGTPVTGQWQGMPLQLTTSKSKS